MSNLEQLRKGTTDIILLTILNERPMYGYEIIQELERRSQGYFTFKEGLLYPALHELEKRWPGDQRLAGHSAGPPPPLLQPDRERPRRARPGRRGMDNLRRQSVGPAAACATRRRRNMSGRSRRQVLLAIFPFIMNGLLFPVFVLALGAMDSGTDTQRTLSVLIMPVHHALIWGLLAAALAVMAAISLGGAVTGLRRGLPLCSAAWLGSVLAGAMQLVKPALVTLSVAAQVAANWVEVALLLLLLVVLARRRSSLFALATAVATLVQARIFNQNVVFVQPQFVPLGFWLACLATVMVVTLLACLSVIAMIRRPVGNLILPLLACVASYAFEFFNVFWWGANAIAPAPLFWGSILPTILVLAIPYLLGRRPSVIV